MSQEPNQSWAPQPTFSLDPFFETRDHANQWDARALLSDDAPKQDDKPPVSPVEDAER